MPNIVLPFRQKEIYLGLAEISGLLRLYDNAIEIEYKVKDTTLGLLDSSVKTCHIPIRIIDSIEVEQKWFSVRVELTFNRIPDLDNPFQIEENRLKLTVKKQHLQKAQSFRSKLMYEILENRIDDLNEEEKEANEERHSYRPRTQESSKRPNTGKREGNDGLENMLRED